MNRSPVRLYVTAAAAIAVFCAAPAARAALVSSSLDESVVGITISFGPGSMILPLTANMTGTVNGEAAAGTTPATAVLTELTPSAGPGAILTVGPPAVGGTVSYATVTNTHSNLVGSATATTRALIRGTPSGPGGGVINSVTVVAITPTSATASGAAFALATAAAHDPLAFAPLAVDTQVTLTMDLEIDPSTLLELDAVAPPGGDAMAKFELDATSDIPGLANLFDLQISDEFGASSVGLAFSSPLMSDPLTQGDFTEISPGDFQLGAAFEQFSITFTIPAGVLFDDPVLGPVGFELDTNAFSESIAEAPEPTSLAVFATGVLAMAMWARRRGSRKRQG